MENIQRLRISELTIACIEGQITKDDLLELEGILNNNKEAIECYIEYLMDLDYFHSLSEKPLTVPMDSLSIQDPNFAIDSAKEQMSLLLSLAEEEKTAPVIEMPKEDPHRELIQKVVYPPREKRRLSKFSICSLIASAAAILFVIAFPRIFPVKSYSVEVATLVDQVDAQWGGLDSGESLEAGSRLWSRKGAIWLKKGTAKIRFDYGAEVILEGPAEFELVDAEKMILNSGRLYAMVPDGATGFTAVTPSLTVIDLGTEFGVIADAYGSTDVHMFKGKASLVPGQMGKKETGVLLLTGQAKSVDIYGKMNDIKLDTKAFIHPAQYEIMSKADKGSDYHRWLAYSYKLRRDPDLVAYYIFEKDPEDLQQLRNVAEMTSSRLHGRFAEGDSSPQWVSGRWPEKDALQFDRTKKQYVSMAPDPVVCTVDPVTIAAWIYCPDDIKGGVIVANAIKSEGEIEKVNFQFGIGTSSKSDTIQYVRHAGKDDERFKGLLEPLNTFSKSYDVFPAGWTMLCVTHDNNRVKYYINGQLYDVRESVFEGVPVEAELMIGTQGIKKYEEEMFNGIMDELMIFKSLLSAAEISEIYRAGKPR